MTVARRILTTAIVGTMVLACSGNSADPTASPDTGGTPGTTAATTGGTHVSGSGGTVASNPSSSGGTAASNPSSSGGMAVPTAGGSGPIEPTTSQGGSTVTAGGTSAQSAGGQTTASGTSATGGTSNGSKTTGGAPAGGAATTGGAAAGGAATGGKAAGGAATGGVSTGGVSTGGKAAGGAATGGVATGGNAAGGNASALPKFIIGADISSVDEAMDRGTRYADTDGTTKSIFEILKNHGFNFIRLRAFVKPGATYGYAYGTGGNCIKSETYCDTAHTVAFAKEIKAAGMGFLLDLHYSDNWTDPGNQIIPEDWRGATSITQLADYVRAYTQDIVGALASAGARPDIVQVGNETTPGMLIHVPNSNTDCWGNNVSTNSVNGSASNWNNLGALLKAGVDGVKAVDDSIKIMVHIENTKSSSGVVNWVRNARNQGVAMDIVGLSCYVAFQGEPSVWKTAFDALASAFTDLSFVIAEYNPQRTQANLLMHDMPNGRGLGTFFWEPTQSGEWGSSMFTFSGNTARANATDFQEFDTIAQNVGLK